jgi:hypothetical protein
VTAEAQKPQPEPAAAPPIEAAAPEAKKGQRTEQLDLVMAAEEEAYQIADGDPDTPSVDAEEEQEEGDVHAVHSFSAGGL